MLGAVHIGNHVQGPYTQAYKHIYLRLILNEGQRNQDYQQIDHMAQGLLQVSLKLRIYKNHNRWKTWEGSIRSVDPWLQFDLY